MNNIPIPSKQMIPQQRVRDALGYDKRTGLFHWRITSFKTRRGQRAGTLDPQGYIRITLDGHCYMAHRLAWFWVNGVWPPAQIDHQNGERADNSWKNLRLASHGENAQNRKTGANNTSGFIGVSRRRDKWEANIRLGGKRVYIGLFGSKEDAAEAYKNAKRALHFFNPELREELQ